MCGRSIEDLKPPVANLVHRKADQITAATTLETAGDLFIDAAIESTDKTIKHLFDGSQDGTLHLMDMTKNGLFISPAGDASTWDVTEALKRTFKLMSIPQAWRTDPDIFPVVLFHEGETDKSPIELNGWTEDYSLEYHILNSGTASASRIVYRGYTIWLLVYEFRLWIDDSWLFHQPRGVSILNGTNMNYYDLDWKDIARSSFDGWLENNKRNGYEISKTDYTHLQYDKDFKTPGFFNIPICSLQTAWETNWDGHSELPCETFPCC